MQRKEKKALETFKDTAIVSIEKFLSRSNPETKKLYAFLDKHPECEATVHPVYDQQNRKFNIYISEQFHKLVVDLKNTEDLLLIEALFHHYVDLGIYASKQVQKRGGAYLDFCGVQRNVPDSERLAYMEMLVKMQPGNVDLDNIRIGEALMPLDQFIEIFIPVVKGLGEDHYPTLRAAQDKYLAEYVNNFKKGNIYQLPVSRTGFFGARNAETRPEEIRASHKKDYGLRVHAKMKR